MKSVYADNGSKATLRSWATAYISARGLVCIGPGRAPKTHSSTVDSVTWASPHRARVASFQLWYSWQAPS
eukprot:9496076-Pyramimonas_sp.AAC.1